ncbi:MAG TPA: hypothetical protein VEY89_05080, partial [Candidatus Dormibacteraeota bacterium]|nr:hypothetical protein [Candidatus Dormibacteraeota bacterium]
LRGAEAVFDGVAAEPVDAAAHALREALLAHVDRAATPMQREELQRAIAILDSDEDGSEVSDVAWPYFVMPEHAYTRDARRLFGAAASAWAGFDEPWPEPARRAVSAAVNSIVVARGEPSARGEPVQ